MERGNKYNGSRATSWYGEVNVTGSSGGLSGRDVEKLKKIVVYKEREERRDNIVIKEWGRMEEGKDSEKVIEEFKKKLGVDCKIMSCRKSGGIYIARVENEEKKKEIRRKKCVCELKGGNIFIEHDLSWEDRKRQE